MKIKTAQAIQNPAGSVGGKSIGFWCLFFGSFLWTGKEMNKKYFFV